MVFIDCFGTIVDLSFTHLEAYRHSSGKEVRSSAPAVARALCDTGGPVVEPERLHEALIVSWKSGYAEALRSGQERSCHERFVHVGQMLDIALSSNQVEAMLDAHSSAMVAATTPVEGVVETLAALRQRAPVVLVSNFDRDETVHRILAHHGLTRFFDAVVISAGVGWIKPFPQIFDAARRAAEAAGIDAEPAFHIGDSWTADVEGARRAGIPPVWFDRGEGHHERAPDDRDPAVPAVTRLSEILSLQWQS